MSTHHQQEFFILFHSRLIGYIVMQRNLNSVSQYREVIKKLAPLSMLMHSHDSRIIAIIGDNGYKIQRKEQCFLQVENINKCEV